MLIIRGSGSGEKSSKNIDLLHELPFYGELNIVKISQAFKRYARN